MVVNFETLICKLIRLAFCWGQCQVLRYNFNDDLLYVHAYNNEHEDNLAQLAVSSVPNIKQKEKSKKDNNMI